MKRFDGFFSVFEGFFISLHKFYADFELKELKFHASIVGTEKITVEYLASNGNTYDVTVTCSPEANIPYGSSLSVTELSSDSDEYINAWDRLFGEEADPYIGMVALDISIVDSNGNKVEPRVPVQVSVTMKQLPEGVDEKDLAKTAKIQHFAEVDGEIVITKVADSNWETNGIEVSYGILETEFEVDGFSTFVITWASSTTISDANSTRTLNLQNGNATYATINVHYVDESGANITRPATSAVNAGALQYTFDTDHMATNITDYEFKEARYGSADGSVMTTVAVTRGNPTTITAGYYKIGTSNNGTPDGFTQSDYPNIYSDNIGTTRLYWRHSNTRICTRNSGNSADYVYTGDVYAYRNSTTTYPFIFTVTDASGAVVDTKSETLETTSWAQVADVFLVYSGGTANKVTLHFVDDKGNPLSGIVYNNETLGDTVTYSLTSLFPNNDSTLDLIASFTKEGYTYSNTYFAQYNGTEGGTPIGNHLRRHNNVLQYRNRADSSSYTNLSDGNDIYCVYSPVPGNTGGGSGSGSETPPDLGEIGNSKKVNGNGDGTYKVELSVSGTAQHKTEETDINVIFVIDDSGSMYDNSRMGPTKTAVKNMANELLKNNTTANNDAIELALVSFGMEGWQATFGTDNTEWTTNYTDFANQIDNWYYLQDQGNGVTRGTNWEAGLSKAKAIPHKAEILTH